MKQITKKILFWLFGSSLVFSLFFWYHFPVEAWTVTLAIKWVGIRHGTPDNINLWTLITSTGNQEISGQFNDYFWIEDLEWYVTGHYTTIQCDGVHGPGWYTLTWVYLKAGNMMPTLISWNPSNVLISSVFSNYYSIYSPATYLYKTTWPGNAGNANRYWDKPLLKIDIPAYTPPGIYSGTIVFSFYMY